MRWLNPPIAHQRRGPRSGQLICLMRTPAASAPTAPRPSSPTRWPGQSVARTGIRPRQPEVVAARPLFGLLWFKLKRASKGEGPIINSPTRPPWRTAVDAEGVCNCPRGGMRRCTNEAVRATRPSEFDSRIRLAEPRAFHSTRADTPTRLGFALHGLALHGQDGEIRVRAYESRPLGALVPGRSQFVTSSRSV